MPLLNGTRLGPYEILGQLGAGGMGEVYRARDPRLGREVAIKVLPSELAATPEMRARFEREARAISHLNHPHICVLHDVGREADTDFLVMELVEGESLAERIARGPLSVEQTLRIGIELAGALERAHRDGIVHRDLKPANVMLTRAGTKLMDFGLARATGDGAVPQTLSASPTRTTPLTAEGTLVGTFQYMAPEQLEGKEADARSDVWALGATLYEAASGRRAFEGESQASLIGAIMRAEPRPLTELVPLSPPAFDRAVRQCLAKDPQDRWQSAGDFKRELQWILEAGSKAGVPATLARRRLGRERIAWTLAATLPLLAFLAGLMTRTGSREEARAARMQIPPPPGAFYNLLGDNAGPPALSPDGRRIAYVAVDEERGPRIWVREVDEFEAQPVPGTEGASYPFWSPDGRSLAFYSFAEAKLKRVDLNGRAAITLCEAGAGRGGAWGPGGTIVFTKDYQSGLWRVPATGGTPVAVIERDTSLHSSHRFPVFLPDGKHLLYFAGKHDRPDDPRAGVYLASLDGRENRQLLAARTSAVYSSGHLLYVRDSVLFAHRFDARRGRLLGDPLALRERVQVDPTTWCGNISAGGDRIAFVLRGARAGTEIKTMDRAGVAQRTLVEAGNHISLFLSRDGSRLVESTQLAPTGDIWMMDLARGLRSRLTFGPQDDDGPVLSPSTDQVAYFSQGEGGRYRVLVQRTDGGGSPRVVLQSAQDVAPTDWSPDGRFLLALQGDLPGNRMERLLAVPLAGGAPVPILQELVTDARFSPDGRWIAFSSPVSGREETYVMSFDPGRPGGAERGRWQVSLAGGGMPRWRKDGRELFYVRAAEGTMVAVDVDGSGSSFQVGQERPLFRAAFRPSGSPYDVSPDGQRFYVNVLGGSGAASLALVSGWQDQLERR